MTEDLNWKPNTDDTQPEEVIPEEMPSDVSDVMEETKETEETDAPAPDDADTDAGSGGSPEFRDDAQEGPDTPENDVSENPDIVIGGDGISEDPDTVIGEDGVSEDPDTVIDEDGISEDPDAMSGEDGVSEDITDEASGEDALVEMESPAEAEEADEENAEAAEDDGDALDLEADEAAELKAEEEEERKAEFAALPITEKAEAEAAGIWKKIRTGAGMVWKKFRSLKIWQQVLIVALVVCLLVVGIAYAYFHSKYVLMDISDGVSYSTEFTDDDEEDEEISSDLAEREESGELVETQAIEATGEIVEDENIFNILLIGTDERSEEFSDNARGDTCMLVSINRATGAISLVSFERATGVKIPSGEYEGQWDWLTHSFWYGGADMMMQVIRENFKVDVDKYIRVNICTFMELIEAVGGVDVELTEAEADVLNDPTGTYTAMHIKTMHVEDEAQHDLVEGMNHLNGATAMLYVRLRAIDDDWHRVVRQRNVIMAIAENFKSLSLTELNDLLDAVLPLVQTNLTEADIASLLADVPSFLNMEFESITFPLQNTYGLMDGMSGRRVLAVDFETNAAELQNLLNGDITAEELEEKYENLEDELEDYDYKDSELWQENYADAEAIAGKTTTSSSSSSSSSSASSSAAAASDTGTTGAESTAGSDSLTAADETTGAAAGDTSSDLGEIESVTTDPDTGVVTTIYYNAETGVRTAIAVNPDNGATAIATEDDTAAAGIESTDGYDAEVSSDLTGETDTTSADASAVTDTAADTSTDTTADTATDTDAATDVTTDAATDTSGDILTGNAAAEAYAAALAAAEAAAAAGDGQ